MRTGNKADYCPPERGLVLGRRGVHGVNRLVDEWMNGWLTGCMDGSWFLDWKAGRAPCPQSGDVREPGQGLGNVRHDTETKLATVPPRRGPVLGYRARGARLYR